jgi:acyl-CoA synthetase (AMP-forming)/AMP-acid ligase II/acyl carrier protein
MMPTGFATLVDALRTRALEQPGRLAFRYLLDGEREGGCLSYEALDQRARAIAVRLSQLGAVGQPVLLLAPPGPAFVAALFGCFYAGAVAVPCYPPSFRPADRSAARLSALVRDCGARLAITVEAHRPHAQWFTQRAAGLGPVFWLAADSIPAELADQWEPLETSPGTLALLQYTSGSTGAPRGVMLTHASLAANQQAVAEVSAPVTELVSWLPPYHDMGLLCILHGVWSSFPVTVMDPAHFLQSPVRWLRAISRYRADASGGPNFAYRHCTDRITAGECAGLDLSCWKVAVNSAEPVRASTLDLFSRTFAPFGFRSDAFCPCYGLAESTVMATGKRRGAGPLVLGFDPAQLQQGHAVPGGAESAARLVSCGAITAGHELAIVDPSSGVPSGESEVGEIWTAGPSVAAGYWGKEEESRAVFDNHLPGSALRFLRTGDLGFLQRGELFVTGRLKDLIIVRGRNYYPQDIEECAAASHPAAGLAAAFTTLVEEDERVTLACQLRREAAGRADPAAVVQAIRRAVAEEFDLALHTVVLLPPGSIPRTTSGKVRRQACREEADAGAWTPLAVDTLAAAPAAPAPATVRLRADAAALHSALLRASPVERVSLIERGLAIEAAALLKRPVPEMATADPLTALGVDSLMRVEIALRIEAAFGVSLAAEELDPAASLADLARLIDQKMAAAGHDSAAPLSAAPGDVPLTPSQSHFLNADFGEPEKYSSVVYLRTRPAVDALALERALRALEVRHEALRLRFEKRDAAWRQFFVPAGSAVRFTRMEVAAAPPERLQALRQELDQEMPGQLDLLHGPVMRAVLLDRGPAETGLLVLAIHHLVADGVSVGVLVSDLQREFAGRGGPARSDGVSFQEWTRLLDDEAQSEATRAEMAHWVGVCEAGRQAAWTGPSAERDLQVRPDGLHRARLEPAERVRFVSRFPAAREQHDAVLAAFASAWGAVTGRPAFFVELLDHGRLPLHGRSPWRTVGWLTNRYPATVALGDANAEALLERTAAAVRAAPREGLGFGLLRDRCRAAAIREAMARLPKPQASFIFYSHMFDNLGTGAGLSLLDACTFVGSRPTADGYFADLQLTVYDRHDTTWWELTYTRAVFGRETIEAISERIGAFLRALWGE